MNYTYKRDIEKMKNNGFINAMEVLEALKLTHKNEVCSISLLQRFKQPETNYNLKQFDHNSSKDKELCKQNYNSAESSKIYNIQNNSPDIKSMNILEVKEDDKSNFDALIR